MTPSYVPTNPTPPSETVAPHRTRPRWRTSERGPPPPPPQPTGTRAKEPLGGDHYAAGQPAAPHGPRSTPCMGGRVQNPPLSAARRAVLGYPRHANSDVHRASQSGTTSHPVVPQG